MSAEVKNGYKLTEVGVIPEDWDVMTLGTVSEMSSGTTPSRTLMDRYYKNGSIAWVKTLDLNNSDICETDECVTDLALKETCLRVNPTGTVLVAMYGGFNQIGRTGLLRLPAAVNQAITAIHPFKGVLLSDYLIRNINYRIEYWKRVASSSRKDPNITSKDIRDFPVACPKLYEQESIAEALGDADALIESLEQLIAKKRQIKQGAMQELLTGKKRLPGFSGEWVEKTLGEIATIKTGSSNNQDKNEDGEYPFFVRSNHVERINSYSHDCEAILIPGEGGIGSIFHYINGRFDVHQRVYAITKFVETVSGLFVFYYMVKNFGAHAMQNSVKATVDSLRLPTFQNFEMLIPVTYQEQAAIASVLSDMDSEIESLGIKLVKARQFKQGMMHNLLTGKTRLA